MGANGVAVPAGVALGGAAGARPLITGAPGSGGSVAAGALLRHVRVEATDDFGNTAVSATGSTVEDVIAKAGGPSGVTPTGVFLGEGALLRDTAVFVTGENAHAVSASAAAPATADL